MKVPEQHKQAHHTNTNHEADKMTVNGTTNGSTSEIPQASSTSAKSPPMHSFGHHTAGKRTDLASHAKTTPSTTGMVVTLSIDNDDDDSSFEDIEMSESGLTTAVHETRPMFGMRPFKFAMLISGLIVASMVLSVAVIHLAYKGSTRVPSTSQRIPDTKSSEINGTRSNWTNHTDTNPLNIASIVNGYEAALVNASKVLQFHNQDKALVNESSSKDGKSI